MAKNAAAKRWKLDLLANGLDFIREGIEALYGTEDTPPERARKYALLHVFSGTLLVLKERLRRAHDSLIFDKVHAARAAAETRGRSTSTRCSSAWKGRSE